MSEGKQDGGNPTRPGTAAAPLFLPSLTDAAMLLPLALLFLRLNGFRMLLGDGDTGWHIRTGEWILANGRVPTEDIFSYTMAGRPWCAWEWLWDVAFAWLHGWGGMAAVVAASIAVISATFGLLFRLVSARCGNALIAFGVTALAAIVSSVHWLARPHLFTILFTAVFLWLLERAREGRLRALIALPLLTVVWVNVHGGFFVGAALILAYAAGECCGGLFAAEPEARRAGFGRSKPYLAAAAACLAASFVNPQFYRLHVHIFRFLAEGYQNANVVEFLPLNLRHEVAPYFEALWALGVLAAAWSVRRGRWAQAILVAGWAHLALFSVRNLPIFAVVAAPAIAWTCEEFLALARESRGAAWIGKTARAIEEFGREYAAFNGAGRFPLAGAGAFAALVIFLALPVRSPLLAAEYDPQEYPAGALAAIKSGSRVFTNDEWGDYLIYRLYPNLKVFIDGRSDFYGAEFGDSYRKLISGRHGWERTLERYGVDTVLLPVRASLAGILKESARWRPVYDDGVAIVFRPSDQPARFRPEEQQVSASIVGGIPVVARSRNQSTVIEGSPSHTRGDL